MLLFFSLVISAIGLAYFVYGKKRAEFAFILFGLILMFYSYFIQSLALSVLLGVVLAACPFLSRKFLG